MTDEEFDQFVTQATEQLRQKQARLRAEYGLGEYADFWFDQDSGTLQFKDSTGKIGLEATITSLGSFSSKSKTWQWSWANESVVPRLREKAESLKGLFELTGMNIFRLPVFGADEPTAWEVAAMAVRYLESLGAYRMPFGKLMVFLAIETIGPPQS